jgi:hypothetical protein
MIGVYGAHKQARLLRQASYRERGKSSGRVRLHWPVHMCAPDRPFAGRAAWAGTHRHEARLFIRRDVSPGADQAAIRSRSPPASQAAATAVAKLFPHGVQGPASAGGRASGSSKRRATAWFGRNSLNTLWKRPGGESRRGADRTIDRSSMLVAESRRPLPASPSADHHVILRPRSHGRRAGAQSQQRRASSVRKGTRARSQVAPGAGRTCANAHHLCTQ